MDRVFSRITVDDLRAKRGVKWTKYGPEVLGAWVADMDFPVAEPIREALREAMAREDYGYSFKSKEGPIPDLFAARAKRLYAWEVLPERVEGICDVVQGLYVVIENSTRPGDGVVTMTPVYPPFLNSVHEMGRRLVEFPLQPSQEPNNIFRLDERSLADLIDDNVRLLLLCNPHNPTGRVFSKAELEAVAEIVLSKDLIVFADEIHADLVYSGSMHIPFASLGQEVEAHTITMVSATKAFNIAGLRYAVAVFGSEALQTTYNRTPECLRGGINSFGVIATQSAWRDCDDWLQGLLNYLEKNRNYMIDFLHIELPDITVHPPEATFLSWLDCSNLMLSPDPHTFFLEKARVGLSDGADFGVGGAGHVRLNFATSRPILTQILTRIRDAVANRPKLLSLN